MLAQLAPAPLSPDDVATAITNALVQGGSQKQTPTAAAAAGD